jgi:hypothetical protein
MQWDDYSIIVESIGNVLESERDLPQTACQDARRFFPFVACPLSKTVSPNILQATGFSGLNRPAGRPGLDLWPGWTWPT